MEKSPSFNGIQPHQQRISSSCIVRASATSHNYWEKKLDNSAATKCVCVYNYHKENCNNAWNITTHFNIIVWFMWQWNWIRGHTHTHKQLKRALTKLIEPFIAVYSMLPESILSHSEDKQQPSVQTFSTYSACNLHLVGKEANCLWIGLVLSGAAVMMNIEGIQFERNIFDVAY